MDTFSHFPPTITCMYLFIFYNFEEDNICLDYKVFLLNLEKEWFGPVVLNGSYTI